MTLTSLIRRSVVQWGLWRSHRETRRAIPILRELDRRRQECRRFHKRGVKAIDKEARLVMTRALAGRL